MFSSERNIHTLEQLAAELKKYAGLQAEYASLQLVEKLTVLFSTLILVFVLLILAIIALFYLSFTLAYVLAPVVGGLKVSFGIITLCILLLIALIAALRQRLIVAPIVHFLTALFLSEQTAGSTPEQKRKEMDESADRIAGHVQTLFVREQPKRGLEGLLQQVEAGVAMYDGARLGVRLMHRFRQHFEKFRKKRKQ
jgi:predicted PurR-regulated permease PerM